jgi:hypothetical protein
MDFIGSRFSDWNFLAGSIALLDFAQRLGKFPAQCAIERSRLGIQFDGFADEVRSPLGQRPLNG